METARKLLAIRAWRRLRADHDGWAARYVICSLLLFGLVWAAWQLGLMARQSPSSTEAVLQSVAVSTPDAAADVEIFTLHLFGVAVSEPLPLAAGTDAVVAGIAYAAEPGASRAILVVNGVQQSFAVGGVLPGGERIVSIEQNQVFVERGDSRQGLILEQKLADLNADFSSPLSSIAAAGSGSPQAGGSPVRAGNTGSAGLQALRQNLSVPPDGLAGKRLQAAARVRAEHRGRVTRKPDG